MTMTLASIGALLVAVTVAASSAVQVNEPEHDPATRQADMCETKRRNTWLMSARSTEST